MFLGKTLDSHSASLYPGVQMVPTNSMLGVTLQWTSTKIFLVASCYRNRNVVGPLAHMQTLPYRLIGPSTAAAGECLSPVCRAHTIFLPWPLFLHTSIVVCFKGSGNSAAQIYPNQNICVICISPVRVYAYAYMHVHIHVYRTQVHASLVSLSIVSSLSQDGVNFVGFCQSVSQKDLLCLLSEPRMLFNFAPHCLVIWGIWRNSDNVILSVFLCNSLFQNFFLLRMFAVFETVLFLLTYQESCKKNPDSSRQ